MKRERRIRLALSEYRQCAQSIHDHYGHWGETGEAWKYEEGNAVCNAEGMALELLRYLCPLDVASKITCAIAWDFYRNQFKRAHPHDRKYRSIIAAAESGSKSDMLATCWSGRGLPGYGDKPGDQPFAGVIEKLVFSVVQSDGRESSLPYWWGIPYRFQFERGLPPAPRHIPEKVWWWSYAIRSVLEAWRESELDRCYPGLFEKLRTVKPDFHSQEYVDLLVLERLSPEPIRKVLEKTLWIADLFEEALLGRR